MKFITFFAIAFLVFNICQNALAGPYSDDLAKCFVNSTTKQDRIDLVRWMFIAASKHPNVQDIASVSEEELEKANKSMANLFMKLLTTSCKEQAQKAIEFEGKEAFSGSFELLGQVAGREIWGSPEVSASMGTFTKYLRLEDLSFLQKKN